MYWPAIRVESQGEVYPGHIEHRWPPLRNLGRQSELGPRRAANSASPEHVPRLFYRTPAILRDDRVFEVHAPNENISTDSWNRRRQYVVIRWSIPFLGRSEPGGSTWPSGRRGRLVV